MMRLVLTMNGQLPHVVYTVLTQRFISSLTGLAWGNEHPTSLSTRRVSSSSTETRQCQGD